MSDHPTPSPTRSEPGWERATIEKLVFATIKEQQSARRWKIFLRVLSITAFALVAWLIYSAENVSTTVNTPHTAIIEIKGEIASGAPASASNVVGALQTAFKDKNAQAIVLLINSPGGSPVQAGIISDEIKRLKTQYNKKVYAVVEETCASAAYYIASATDNIYVDKASVIGSIGVLMDSFGFTGLMEKLGIERRLMTAGQNKAMLDPFSPQNDTQRAYMQSMLNEIHAQFIEVVRQGRGKRLKETPETFSGLVWSGQTALSLGLVDGFGNVDSVARDIVKAPETVDYTQHENIGFRLAKELGLSMGQGIFLAAQSAQTTPK